MAKPRVFISSTFYDQQQIRIELEAFVRGMGYEPVLSEHGHITFSKEIKPEESCYKEAATCDILVAVIGGKLGSTSQDEPYSVAQKELKSAVEACRQVYIFIYQPVFVEYETFRLNKDENPGIKYAHANDPQVYRFIEELCALERNNAIFPFSTSNEIMGILREQWAGLLKRFLDEGSQLPQWDAIRELHSTADSLKQVVDYVRTELPSTGTDMQTALMASHPLFVELATLLRVDYRVFFMTKGEMGRWLQALGFRSWSDPFAEEIPYYQYELPSCDGRVARLQVSTELFDKDGRLKLMAPDEWLACMAKVVFLDSDSQTSAGA